MAVQPATDNQQSASGDVAVLVPAAGTGRRLGGRRKQFRMLGGQPLLVQTLRAFECHPAVDHLIVAAPQERVQAANEMLHAASLTKLKAVVSGGASRQNSVRLALRAVPATVEVVLVHDAVRPFIEAAAIQDVIDAVRATGAAALAVPVADTLREGTETTFGTTVPRDGLYRMQTPQGFQRALFESAHRRAVREDVSATDDVELVQQAGHAVQIVIGCAQNIKITTPDDWTLAQHLWAHWTERVAG